MTPKQFWTIVILILVGMILDFTYFAISTQLASQISIGSSSSQAADLPEPTPMGNVYSFSNEPYPACPDTRYVLKKGDNDTQLGGPISGLQGYLIAYGERGPAQAVWQTLLRGLEVNGTYGARTEKAVMQFQKEHSLVSTGVFDASTFDAVFHYCGN